MRTPAESQPDASNPGELRHRAPWQKPATAFIVAAAFLLPILISLVMQVPGTIQTGITGRSYDERSVPVDIRGRASVESDGIFFVHQRDLSTTDVTRFTSHQQIQLLVIGYKGDPDLKDGELLFEGTPCAYRTAPGARLVKNSILSFVRTPECGIEGKPTGRIALKLRFWREAHVALLTYARPPEQAPRDALLVSRFGLEPSNAVLVARGAVFDVVPDAGASRLQLLAYVWNISDSPRWIVGAVVAAALSLFAAVALGWRSSGQPVGFRATAAAFAAAMSFSTLYAVLIPPFQAADEPNHFMALVGFIGRPELANDATDLAGRGHFEEIQFNSYQRFSPLDRGTPGIPWNDGVAPDAGRGTGVTGLWALVRPFVRGLTAPRLLLTMRLIHGAIFSLAVAAFVWLVQRFTDADYPELLALPLFLVPTLPYFGMFVSNYALLTSVYVLFAAAMAVASWDGPKAHIAGPVLGLALIAAVSISRSAVPLFPFAGAVLLARLLLGDEQERLRPAAVHWMGLSAIVIAGLSFADADYVQRVQATVLDAAIPGRRFHLRGSVLLWCVAIAGVLLTGLELSVGRLRRLIRERFGVGRIGTVRFLALGAASLVGLVFAASLVVRYPILEPINTLHPPGLLHYIRDAELACLTFLRFGRPDSLTSVTFWGGFGWLEALPPDGFISVLAAASGLALVALLLWVALTVSARALVWLACAALGFVFSVAGYALSVLRVTPADLHGRYLLGLYLSVLVIAWSSLPRLIQQKRIRWPPAATAAAVAGCLAVHAYSLTFILARYF